MVYLYSETQDQNFYKELTLLSTNLSTSHFEQRQEQPQQMLARSIEPVELGVDANKQQVLGSSEKYFTKNIISNIQAYVEIHLTVKETSLIK